MDDASAGRAQKPQSVLDRIFGLKQPGSDVRTEFIAGLTTFLTMVYIVFVNPPILGKTGMDNGAVFVATCIAAAVSTMVMALYANYPIALAPGMGINAFFAFTVVLTYKYTWQQALAAVFCSGVMFFLISVFRIRQYIINSIPQNLKLAISAGVGLFLGIIALEEAKIVVAQPATLVTLGDLKQSGRRSDAFFGFVLITALNYRRIIGGTLIGILVVTVIGMPFGLAQIQRRRRRCRRRLAPTLLQLDFSRVSEGTFLIVVFSFLFIDVFDNAGTLIGVTHRTGLMKQRQARAHETGADLRQLRRHVRLADRHLDHDQLYRERGRRLRRRPHRADRRLRGDLLPAGAVVRAARRHGAGLRVFGGAALRRLRDGARACRDRLGRHHRIRARRWSPRSPCR